MEKQIEKIIKHNGMHKHTGSAIVENVCKAIAALYEGWYPSEFWMWLIDVRYPFVRRPGEWYRYDTGNVIYTLPDLFKYWQDNVEGK